MKNHLKRIKAPKTWKISRKTTTFTTKPNPGMHTTDYGFALVTGMRDLLGLGNTRKEIRDILNNNEVFVDGKRRKDHRFNIGFMDVLRVPKINKSYRVVFNQRGKLSFIEIDEKEADQKVVRIKNKTSLGKQIQLNLSDGRNVLVDKDSYKVNDSVVIELPSQTIKEHLPMEKGASVLLIGGKHLGTLAHIEKIEGDGLVFKTKEDMFETHKKHAFVVGKKEPSVTIQ